jgi:hypothetical protein
LWPPSADAIISAVIFFLMTKYPIDLLSEAAGSEIGGPQEDDIPEGRE